MTTPRTGRRAPNSVRSSVGISVSSERASVTALATAQSCGWRRSPCARSATQLRPSRRRAPRASRRMVPLPRPRAVRCWSKSSSRRSRPATRQKSCGTEQPANRRLRQSPPGRGAGRTATPSGRVAMSSIRWARRRSVPSARTDFRRPCCSPLPSAAIPIRSGRLPLRSRAPYGAVALSPTHWLDRLA
jgi:hypothetical protein